MRASIGSLALSVHTRTAKTLQTLRFNFVQQLRKLIIDSCDSRLSQAASSNIGQHISCQAAGMITLGNLMSCSERQSGWTVSKRCTVTFLILNAFEYHLVSRDVTTQKKESSKSVASVPLPATCDDVMTYSYISMTVQALYACHKLCGFIAHLSNVARGTYPRERYHGAIARLQGMRSTAQ